jgi:hypothetical protein
MYWHYEGWRKIRVKKSLVRLIMVTILHSIKTKNDRMTT